MLNRSRIGSSPAWLRRAVPLIGAAIAAAIGAWLTVVGVNYALNGCDCEDALRPDWLWAPIIALAVAFCAVAVALLWRFVKRGRSIW